MTDALSPLDPDAVRQLDGFIAKFSNEVDELTHALFNRMRRRIPGACIPVYDNYAALAIGFGPSERVKDVVLSLAVFPRWVTLCFTWGVRLDDPHGILSGGGNQVRHVRLPTPESLDDPKVDLLIAQALAKNDVPVNADAEQRLVIKSISAKQRPRRP